jgi:hypothetical protein
LQQQDPPSEIKHIVIADSGATAHYGTSALPVLNKTPCTREICIRTANGAIMRATHEAELDIPALPKAARHIYIVPELADKTLLSVSQLCQANCQVIFHGKAVTVHHDGKVVLKGGMMDGSNLWQMEMPDTSETTTYYAANAALYFNTAAEIVKFMHAALGYPVLATLDKALEMGLIKGFPGLSRQTLRSHPPYSDATIKGHMAQTRKNIRSTKEPKQKREGKKQNPASQNDEKPNKAQCKVPPTCQQEQTERANSKGDQDPSAQREVPLRSQNELDERASSESQNLTGNDGTDTEPDDPQQDESAEDGNSKCYATLFRPQQKSYSDQTGEFVCTSMAKNKYVYIMYEYTSNFIFAEPIQSTSDNDITKAFEKCIETLKNAEIMPKMHLLDNQCGKLQIAALEGHGISYQIVPPGIHRRNAAERAIRMFKDHFISILCGTDNTFPLRIWDKIIPQAVLTLNLLRASRLNPKNSAYAQIHGPFDYNKTPIAPLGYRVLVHVKPHLRGTWDPKAEDGFYIGPAKAHYRCVTVYITDTDSTRITDTVSWIPENTGVPTMAPSDEVIMAIRGLQKTIQGVPKDNILAERTDEKIGALQQLTELFAPSKNNAGEMRVTDPVTNPTLPLMNVTTIPESRTAIPESNAGKMRVDSTTATPFALPPGPSEPITRPIGPPLVMAQPKEAEPTTFKELTGARGAKYRRTQRRKHIPVKLRDDHATHVYHIVRSSAETDAEFLAYYGHAVNPDTKKLAEYPELIRSTDAPKWIEGMEDEWGRLANGNERNEAGTKTLRFVRRDEIPDGYIPTYCRIVVAYRPEKEKPYHVRITVGGDRVIFNGECSTKAADLATIKLLLNSVISTPGARFMTLDIKDFYLNTVMKFEDRVYMRIPEKVIPESIKARYNVQLYNGVAYVEVTKGMYGLKQAGRLANEQLAEFLAPFGYAPNNTRTMETRNATNPILTCGGRFRNQVCKRGRQKPPRGHTSQEIHHKRGPDRQQILRHAHRMGLQSRHMRHFNAGIHRTGPRTISTQL